MDVSYEGLGTSHVYPTFCWKHPSGCMIEEMPNGLSRVTCVERVEVDDDISVHPIYEGLVKSTLAFGAKRWITTLQRVCERYAFLKEAGILNDTLGIGRRGVIMHASRMIKNYCSIFESFEFLLSPEMSNKKVQIAVHRNTLSDQPVGIIIRAVSSFWVPASPMSVFNFLNDHSMRGQWDVLCNGNQVCAVMQMPTGRNPSNCISILQPSNAKENLMMLQESAADQLGSFIVYAPIDSPNMLDLATGTCSALVPMLASGFAVTTDGPSGKLAASTSTRKPWSGGSVITAAFQFLVSSSLLVEHVGMDNVARADLFLSRVVDVLTNAFNCRD